MYIFEANKTHCACFFCFIPSKQKISLSQPHTAYVLQWYVYEGAKYDPSSKVAESGYDVVICLMEMAECFDKGHHLFRDNL